MRRVLVAVAFFLTLTVAIWIQSDRADQRRRQFVAVVNDTVEQTGDIQAFFAAQGTTWVVTPVQADMSQPETDSAMGQLFDSDRDHVRAREILKAKGFKTIEIVGANGIVAIRNLN
jgi:hypothetical protein